ncbi:MAG: rhodanese-like domain-containing protein, partial [Phyllobacterium sp.]
KEECAVLDVREAGEFADGHLLFAASAPLGVFEMRLLDLVPMPLARLVLVDDGLSGRAGRAARLAFALGYAHVTCLEGGTAAWAQAGFTLFEGVYVPSKVFGELVHETFAVAHISAQELVTWQDEGRSFLLLDGRPFEEHRRMNIPGSVCLPNGELPYRIGTILHDSQTPVVIHCAGRTRSIIGAQILKELGLKNPVFALNNGTQGWALANFPLERGSTRMVGEKPGAADQEAMAGKARSAAAHWNIPLVDAKTATDWANDPTRTTYFFDVRSEEEFADDGIPGSVHAPGGQLLQSTDSWAAVRGARMVLIDPMEVRAVTAARWLSQMGWDCHVLTGGREGWGEILLPERRRLPEVNVPVQASLVSPGSTILDMRASQLFRESHIEGARWTLRSRLAAVVSDLDKRSSIILCGDREMAGRIAADLGEAGYYDLAYLAGEPAEWRAMGHALVATPDDPKDHEAADFVFFTHDRHSGNMEAARTYLAWETGLVARLDEQERKQYRMESVSPLPFGMG